MSNKIIRDMRNGNPTGEGYSVKEILTAHIHDNKNQHGILFDELKAIRKNYSSKKMVLGIGSTLFTLIGALAYYVLIVIPN